MIECVDSQGFIRDIHKKSNPCIDHCFLYPTCVNSIRFSTGDSWSPLYVKEKGGEAHEKDEKGEKTLVQTSASKNPEPDSTDDEPPLKKTRLENHYPRPACNCRLNCSSKIKQSLRENICKLYWEIPKELRKEEYKKFGLVTKNPPKSVGTQGRIKQTKTYMLYNELGERVTICKCMFLRTFDFHETNNRAFS